ncbi:helix-turn-helix transcriptional regulator [Streptomyces sp. NPDC051976]|uniref:helix-turn-helix domain-containing protein n=1 Tax=Streptomyces sp. NPDC051976 TaxID=3154947 RepID=UPI0034224C72
MPMKELDPAESVAALFGAKVRKLRERAGLTQQDLGERVYVSHTRIAKVELASEPAGWKLAQLLDESLNASGELVELWPHLTSDPYPDYVKRLMAMQVEAVAFHCYSPLIPGLLQTEGYVRALLDAGQVFGDWDVEELAEKRLSRQAQLEGDDPLWFWAVIDEAALYRGVGGPTVMREQLRHLMEIGKRKRVCVQICPMGRLDPAVLTGGMVFLMLPDGTQVVYLEGNSSGVLLDDPSEVVRHRIVYDRLQSEALSQEASVDLIRKVLEEHHQCAPPELT